MLKTHLQHNSRVWLTFRPRYPLPADNYSCIRQSFLISKLSTVYLELSKQSELFVRESKGIMVQQMKRNRIAEKKSGWKTGERWGFFDTEKTSGLSVTFAAVNTMTCVKLLRDPLEIIDDWLFRKDDSLSEEKKEPLRCNKTRLKQMRTDEIKKKVIRTFVARFSEIKR